MGLTLLVGVTLGRPPREVSPGKPPPAVHFWMERLLPGDRHPFVWGNVGHSWSFLVTHAPSPSINGGRPIGLTTTEQQEGVTAVVPNVGVDLTNLQRIQTHKSRRNTHCMISETDLRVRDVCSIPKSNESQDWGSPTRCPKGEVFLGLCELWVPCVIQCSQPPVPSPPPALGRCEV